MLNAYQKKAEVLQQSRKLEVVQHAIIYTEKPIVYAEEKKYEHARTAVFQTRGYQQPTSSKQQVSKVIPKIHRKLSHKESFPHAYKKLWDPNISNVSGDYPREASAMLKGTSSANLNFAGRSSDFISEVKWRMQLRNAPDPRYE